VCLCLLYLSNPEGTLLSFVHCVHEIRFQKSFSSLTAYPHQRACARFEEEKDVHETAQRHFEEDRNEFRVW
jgi:hypothetical protein